MMAILKQDPRMNANECRAYFDADLRRLPALNSIRASKGVAPYSADEAVDIMCCLGGCSRQEFDGIDTAIRAEIARDAGRVTPQA